MLTSSDVLTIRCGANLTYEASDPTHIVLLIQPRQDEGIHIGSEQLFFTPEVEVETFIDPHGNTVRRFDLPVGRTTIRHDSFVTLTSRPECMAAVDGALAVREMPAALLRYTLPTRYCDSDRLMDFAYQNFGGFPQGLQRVQAICDWVHNHLEYRRGCGSPHTTATEVVAQGYGICRDFAHVAISLCRCFNIPARYVSGHLPDVACHDGGDPMDFHAYFQVYVGHRWNTYDARFNVGRIGRVHIACGFDAVDCAFSTLYGPANLSWFEVWNYQVDPNVVKLGDPIDLTKRLDGEKTMRFS